MLFAKAAGLLVLITVVLVSALRWVNPPTTAFMFRNWLSSSAREHEVRQQWVRYEDISRHLALAAVAAEDQRFPAHNGFDFGAIKSAFEHNKKGRGVRGASTITQQVSKNLFLWSGRSYLRKGLEAYFTVLIEFIWPKQRILEVYLNIAQMGPGVFGVGAASEEYFGLPAGQVGPRNAALLVAVLPSPGRYDVRAPTDYLRNRQSWILTQMQALGGTRYLEGM